MLLPQISIRALLFAVSLIAADFAFLRLAISGYPPLGLVFGVLGTLPMANIIAVTCYRSLTRRAARQPFIIGFGLSGSLAILGWFHFCMAADENRLAVWNTWIARTLDGNRYIYEIILFITSDKTVISIYFVMIYLSFVAMLTTLPQLLLALSGGWLARRVAASAIVASFARRRMAR